MVLSKPSSPDVIIMVMGMTGAGKSTFISTLTDEDAGVGHTLQSCTQGVSMHSLQINNRHIYLIDTPGFNDTWRSDIEVLREIAFFMGQTYRKGALLAGIVYLHRITDNRVGGSCAKNFAMLQALCGSEAASRTVLATSMWSSVAPETSDFQAALRREKELVRTPEFWGRLAEHGSQTKRWAGDRLSAHQIVDDILSIHDANGVQPTRLHREYVDEGRELLDTSAGHVLLKEHKESWDSLRGEMDVLRREWEQAEQRRAHTMSKQLREQRLALKKELKASEAAKAELKVTLQGLAQEKERQYKSLLAEVEKDRQKMEADLAKREKELKRLEEDAADNDKVLAEALQVVNSPTGAAKTHKSKSDSEMQRWRQERAEFRAQWEREQKLNDEKRKALAQTIQKVKKRTVVKRNLIPLLGILAGGGVIAAGAVTGLIPVIAAGVGVLGSAANNLNFSRQPRKSKEWQVDERE